MLKFKDDDELISVRLTDGTKDILIGTRNGYVIRFEEEQIRSMGRTAAGVKGISLRNDDEVVSMEIIEDGYYVLNVTENGYGKRTPVEDYRRTNRGGKGIFTCNVTDKTGEVIAVKTVTGEEDIMIMTVSGVLIRMQVEGISTTGRNTQGVRLIRLQEEEKVATVAKIDPEEDSEEEGEVQEEN